MHLTINESNHKKILDLVFLVAKLFRNRKVSFQMNLSLNLYPLFLYFHGCATKKVKIMLIRGEGE